MTAPFLTLVGGGAFGRELIGWIGHAVSAGSSPPVTGFLDASDQALAGFGYDLPHCGSFESYQPVDGQRLVIAIGDPVAKAQVVAALRARGARFASVVHPTSVVAGSAQLGEGVVICPLAMVSADARIGDFAAINAMSSVGHDVSLGACSTLSAHVDLTGWVEVGEACFFGSGARVLPKVRIGERARIGAGAVVVRHVEAGAVMYAAPARKL